MSGEHWLRAFVRAWFAELAASPRAAVDPDALVDAILAEERRRYPLTAIVVCPFSPCNMHFAARGERALEDAALARDKHLANGCPFDPFGPRR